MADVFRTASCKIIIVFFVLLIVSGCLKKVRAPSSIKVERLTLLLTDPQKDFVTTSSRTYEVKGVVRGGRAPLKISVGDRLTELIQEGPFVVLVHLKPGDNLFTLAVKDARRAEVSRDFTIKAIPVPLKIVLDETPPRKTTREEIILKVTIQGGWGNTELKVNDARIGLGDIRQFSYPVKLSEGANNILLSAKDASGQSDVWPGDGPLVIYKITEPLVKEEGADIISTQAKIPLEIIAQKAGYEDNDKLFFDLKSQELKKIEAIIIKGGKVIVAGKINSKAKPEYLGEIVAIAQMDGLRVKVQLRTQHPNIRLSLYNEFLITEQ
ncbi:MAG: hypothetical protein BWK74_06400 [Desulfobacteraceae bacterium A6]|nr:MAG: hypothetical protein BWK74_06400 [Desulfobacteraceae bacterium A6]